MTLSPGRQNRELKIAPFENLLEYCVQHILDNLEGVDVRCETVRNKPIFSTGFKFVRNKIRAKCLILHFANQHEVRRCLLRASRVPGCQRKYAEIPEQEF